MVWQVEVDFRWRTWVDYSVEHTQTLEAAWEAMSSSVTLPPNPQQGRRDAWTVSFVTMQQRNDTTGTIRRVRRMLTTHA